MERRLVLPVQAYAFLVFARLAAVSAAAVRGANRQGVRHLPELQNMGALEP